MFLYDILGIARVPQNAECYPEQKRGMLGSQVGNFRQCVRGIALALAHSSAQCPSQDLLVGRCSDIHKDVFTKQDAEETGCARKYFSDAS